MTVKNRGLAPRRVFFARIGRAFGYAGVLVVATLAIGTLGYRLLFPGAGWVDAFHQSAMLLSGMGPVLPEDPATIGVVAKLFDSFYALFCGLVLIGTTGVLIAPLLHRLLHRFHLEDTRE